MFYVFDISIEEEYYFSILLDKMLEILQVINYCFLDYKFYVYNDGYLIFMNLVF